MNLFIAAIVHYNIISYTAGIPEVVGAEIRGFCEGTSSEREAATPDSFSRGRRLPSALLRLGEDPWEGPNRLHQHRDPSFCFQFWLQGLRLGDARSHGTCSMLLFIGSVGPRTLLGREQQTSWLRGSALESPRPRQFGPRRIPGQKGRINMRNRQMPRFLESPWSWAS